MSGESKSQRRARRRRKSKGGAKAEATFWGDATALPPPPESVRITHDPAAVLRSIGRPPLSAPETLSSAYFEAVCQRTVALSRALAAAGDLIDADELV